MTSTTMNGVIVSTDPSGRRVATLRADDDIRFAKVFEAINAVVGTDYTGWMKATWPTPVKNEDSFYLWFPKLAEERDGELIPAANDCINTISDDWNEVIFEDLLLRHPESLRNETAYILIFAKETGGGDYVFRGVYLPDNEKSRPNYHVSRRVATEVQIIVSPDLHSSARYALISSEEMVRISRLIIGMFGKFRLCVRSTSASLSMHNFILKPASSKPICKPPAPEKRSIAL